MKRIIYSIIDYFCPMAKQKRQLRKAKQDAILRSELENTRFFVLPDWNGVPKAMTRDTIKILKKKGILSKQVNIYNLEKEALFIADPPKILRRRIIVKQK